MKRWTLRILLCPILLTGGAITTVAVAWIASVNHSWRNPIKIARASNGSDAWIVWRWEGPAAIGIYSQRYQLSSFSVGAGGGNPEALVPRYLLSETVIRNGETWREVSVLATGWPMIALRWIHKNENITEGVSVKKFRWHLPVGPIYSGFLIDTLFYAAIWGGVFCGFGSAKRAIRRKRGQCPRCGYDLRGGVMSDKRLAISGETAAVTAGCPECGWGREGNLAQTR